MLPVEKIKSIHKARDEGKSKRSVSLDFGVDYGSVRKWWNKDAPVIQLEEIGDLKSPQYRFESDSGYQQNYVYLLGLYLGDGYINLQNEKYGVYKLRITQTSNYVNLIEEHKQALHIVLGTKSGTFKPKTSNSVDVFGYSKQIPLLFPQMGIGRKHERIIKLEDWQQILVELHPAKFIRGLLQSDGCRYVQTQGKNKYLRYAFTNASFDIISLFCTTCDLMRLHYTRSTRPKSKQGTYITTITIRRKEDVLRLEELVGPKS